MHNTETVRYRYFLDLLMANRRPVMLVGNAGCGKTVLINDKLAQFNAEETLVTTIPLNYYTNSLMLQQVMEKPLEKKAGRNFGPPGTKKLVYFVDDMNMPEVDTYGTVQPHTLIRQHLDYSHWYDRAKQTLKEVHNVQYVASMNPTAGSFTINSRLQRHFRLIMSLIIILRSGRNIYIAKLLYNEQLPTFQSVLCHYSMGPPIKDSGLYSLLNQILEQDEHPEYVSNY